MHRDIDIRRFPWIRPLVSAYTNDFPTVASLFAGDSSDPAAWRQTITRVQRAPRDRATLAGLLDRQLTRRGAPPEARAAAARLADPSAVAVVTGQQAGVFGGPFYTLLKAVTTLQLAEQVRTVHGTPAVAVFWVEAEDHDWAEVRSAEVLDADLAIREVVVGDLPGAGAHPISSLTFDGEIAESLSALEAALAPTEFTAECLTRLRAHYKAGAGVAGAFAQWLEELLGRHGLVVFEAADPDAKPLAANLFARELAEPRAATLARQTGEAMGRLGHAPQVEPADDSVALFYFDQSGRRAIKRAAGGYLVGDAVRSKEDLQQEAGRHPERFSPAVLLRPLVQDQIFPTVCYVGGPSEIAYQAQLGSLYADFGVERPLLHPRASATVLDSASLRFLDKYDVAFESLQAQDDSALNHLLARQLPPAVEQHIGGTERDLLEHARQLKDAVVAIDPTLAGAVDTTLDKMRETLKHLQNKIVQASKRKDETLRRQFAHARALAFPGGDPQERALNVSFFVNRYGLALCDRLLEHLPLDGSKHYLITL